MPDSGANIASRALAWLRAGYPQGIPSNDYVALYGILHRALTEDEVEHFAQQLGAAAADPETAIAHDDIQAIISQNVHQEPSAEDVARVVGRLAEGGWRLASAVDAPEDPA